MTDSVNKRWPIIQDILSREGVAKQHLNSFDEFLKKGLQDIIDEIGHIDIENAESIHRTFTHSIFSTIIIYFIFLSISPFF